MNTSSKVVVVEGQAFFIAQHTLLKIFLFLETHPQVMERVCLRWIVGILGLGFN